MIDLNIEGQASEKASSAAKIIVAIGGAIFLVEAGIALLIWAL